jgi:hypothetical protein
MRKTTLSLFAALTVLITACHSSASNHSASGEASKAKVAAVAADAQLTKDGYSPVHIPGFGKVDVGLSKKPSAPRYEAVYSYTGKDPATLRTLVKDAQSKLAGQKGVTVRYVGTLVVVRAATLSDLKTAAKAVASSVK